MVCFRLSVSFIPVVLQQHHEKICLRFTNMATHCTFSCFKSRAYWSPRKYVLVKCPCKLNSRLVEHKALLLDTDYMLGPAPLEDAANKLGVTGSDEYHVYLMLVGVQKTAEVLCTDKFTCSIGIFKE